MMTKTKKTVKCLFAAVMILIFMLNIPIFGTNGENTVVCQNSDKASAVYLYNPEKNDVLFAQNAELLRSPASTVKLMTAIVSYQHIKNTNAKIVITERMIQGVETNTMKLQVGEEVYIRDLFIALVCGGYNDAAQALAVISFGTVPAFITRMNQVAKELGATNTLYKDPTGIDDSATTTAKDTILIAKEFMDTPILLEYSSLPSHEIPATNLSEARRINNRNALKSAHTGSQYLNSSALGMNAGMTYEGGFCLVTAVKNGDMTYICVVLGAKYDPETNTTYSYVIANELLAQITRLGYRCVLRSDAHIGDVSVTGASINSDSTTLRPQKDIYAYLPDDFESSGLLKIHYFYNEGEINAPLNEGDILGRIVVTYGDEIVGTGYIVSDTDIEASPIVYALNLIRGFLTSRAFVLILVSFVTFIMIKYFSDRRSARYKNARGRRY